MFHCRGQLKDLQTEGLFLSNTEFSIFKYEYFCIGYYGTVPQLYATHYYCMHACILYIISCYTHDHSGFSSVSSPCRHVHIAEGSSIPVMVSSCLEFLRSEPFCRLLAHLTGLDLAEDIIRPSLEQLDGPDSETSAASDETSAAESTNTVAVAASCSSSKDGESNSNIPRAIVNVCSRDEDRNNCHKAVPHSEHSNNTTPISLPSLEDTNAPSSSHSEDENASSALIGHSRPVANCRGDLYYWQHGDYTLASDFDIETGEYALETALYFCCEGRFIDL